MAGAIFDAQSTASSTANAVTTHDHNNLTVGAGTNRGLLIELNFSNKTPGTVTVTWDQGGTNQVCTQVGAANGSGTVGRAEIWALLSPTPGNKTLRVTNSNASDIVVAGIAYSGVTQDNFAGAFNNFISATGTQAGTTTANITDTLTTRLGDVTVAAFTSDQGTFNSSAPTQVYVNNVPANMSTAGCRGAGLTGGPSSLAMTANLTTGAAAANWVAAGCDVVGTLGVGSILSSNLKPGASPGYAPLSARFWQPQWNIPATATASPDVTLAISGVSTTTSRGTVGATHTNVLTGVSETSSVGTIKATSTKSLSGVSTTTGRGSVAVQHANALTGVSTVTARGTVGSTRTVPITGVQATGSVGTVTPTTGIVVALSGASSTAAVGTLSPSVVVAISGAQALGLVGNITVSGSDVVEAPVSKTRHIIYVKGRRHKSSHREMDELLDRVFAPDEAASVPAPLVEQVHEIVQPFIYKNELNVAKLYKDMKATRALFAAWEAEVGRRASEDEDDDESILLMS